jgi:hypothetical protein
MLGMDKLVISDGLLEGVVEESFAGFIDCMEGEVGLLVDGLLLAVGWIARSIIFTTTSSKAVKKEKLACCSSVTYTARSIGSLSPAKRTN